ncbi:ketopantoate reductase family protein [Microcella frigidaquae]|uniref:2-dehydropantoate 2-reductase n=1 Tax=Microcella frigidaquae TaxID=424758 RepID=A0A840XR62_9MICO|nr:2-dehydropantoate 2-reductase [Microcella frigidaquae]MBB5618419.1 2-dehydropantoate 2-reductase [Microcella frigidaquae]NHN44678.1 2-dehydropantoate 2-reductase [Microcella frigidaquae]
MELESVRIAVVGTGAVGGSVSADLAEAGFDVTLIDQWPAHVETMRADGLTVNTLGAERTVAVRARHLCEVAELRQPFDIVLTGVKTYDTRWVAELMRPLLREDSVFVGLQNGMTIDESAELLGAERTIGCAMGIAANLPEPGYINREVTPAGTWFAIGTLDGARTARLEQLAAVLAPAATVEVTDDVRSAKWMKLIANIPEMLPSALLGVPLLEAATMPGIRPVMDAMSREAYALALDLGIAIRPALGIAPEDVPDGDQYSLDLLDRVLSHFSQPGTKVAVLQDWEKGRRGELDAFSGYIVRKRAELGGRAPVNEAVLRLAERLERGELSPSPENAPLLRDLLAAS